MGGKTEFSHDSSKNHKTEQTTKSDLEIIIRQDERYHGARCAHCREEFPDRYRPVCAFASDPVIGIVQRLYHPDCTPRSAPTEPIRALIERQTKLDKLALELDYSPTTSGVTTLLASTLVPFVYAASLVRKTTNYARIINPSLDSSLRDPQNLPNSFNQSEIGAIGTFAMDVYAFFVCSIAASDTPLAAIILPVVYAIKSAFIYHATTAARNTLSNESKKIQEQIDLEGKTTYKKTLGGTLFDAGDYLLPFGPKPSTGTWYHIDNTDARGTNKRLSFTEPGFVTRTAVKAGDKVTVYENDTCVRVEIRSKWLGKLVHERTYQKKQAADNS